MQLEELQLRVKGHAEKIQQELYTLGAQVTVESKDKVWSMLKWECFPSFAPLVG